MHEKIPAMKEAAHPGNQPSKTTKRKVKCWQVFRCGMKQCPAYRSRNLNCWLISGTCCRDALQGKFIDKLEMCIDCTVFKKNLDAAGLKKTYMIFSKQFREYRKMAAHGTQQLNEINREMESGMSEVFEALDRIAAGDPSVRISETSKIELIRILKHAVNTTARKIGQIVDQSHEFAISLAEHFDVMHRVSKGDLSARVTGSSEVELLEALKHVYNEMIESVNKEITHRREVERELKESEERFKDISFSMADWVWEVNEEGRYTYCSDKVKDVLGYVPEDILGKTHFDFMPSDEAERVGKIFSEIIRNKDIIRDLENWNIRKDGRKVCLLTNGVPVIDESGIFKGYRGVDKDITKSKEAELALRESEEKFRTISSSAKDAIIMVDDEGTISFWNNAAEQIFGYVTEEIVGQKIHEHLVPVQYQEASRKGLSSFQLTGFGPLIGKTSELSAIRKDGTEFPISLSISSVRLNEKWNAIGILRDITSRKKAEEELKAMSLHDELTGLYNRRGLMALAEQQLRIADRMKRGMLMLFADLDGMKQINDTHGHHEGDLALKKTARILKDTFRDSDIVARVGGDEFVVLALETNESYCDLLANRLKENLDLHNRASQRHYALALSIGIAHYDPEFPCSVEKLISQADTLMYEQKKRKLQH